MKNKEFSFKLDDLVLRKDGIICKILELIPIENGYWVRVEIGIFGSKRTLVKGIHSKNFYKDYHSTIILNERVAKILYSR